MIIVPIRVHGSSNLCSKTTNVFNQILAGAIKTFTGVVKTLTYVVKILTCVVKMLTDVRSEDADLTYVVKILTCVVKMLQILTFAVNVCSKDAEDTDVCSKDAATQGAGARGVTCGCEIDSTSVKPLS